MLRPARYTFLYPSFDDHHTDVDHLFFSTKKADGINKIHEVISNVFHAVPMASPASQATDFQTLIKAALGRSLSYDSLTDIYETIGDAQVESAFTQEDIFLSKEDIVQIIKEKGKPTEEVIKALEEAAEKIPENLQYNVDTLVPKEVTIETNSAMLRINVSDIKQIQKKVIDGQEYYLVPCKNSVFEDYIVK